MLTSRGRFGEERVVDVTKLMGPLVPVHGVVGFPDPIILNRILQRRYQNTRYTDLNGFHMTAGMCITLSY